MTTTYWEIGRRIVEREQAGVARAGYGEALLLRLSADLTKRFGRGFSVDRLETARLFYLAYPAMASPTASPATLPEHSATVSRKSTAKKPATSSLKLMTASRPELRLSWSQYVLGMLGARDPRVFGDLAEQLLEADDLGAVLFLALVVRGRLVTRDGARVLAPSLRLHGQGAPPRITGTTRLPPPSAAPSRACPRWPAP
jgi:DUF1016 N-terminal domain